MSCPHNHGAWEDADVALQMARAALEARTVAMNLNDDLLASQYLAEAARLQNLSLLHTPSQGHA